MDMVLDNLRLSIKNTPTTKTVQPAQYDTQRIIDELRRNLVVSDSEDVINALRRSLIESPDFCR